MSEFPKKFRLQEAGVSSAGYPYYEREEPATEDWLYQTKKIMLAGAEQVEQSTAGIGEAIEARSLTPPQRKALQELLLVVAPSVLAATSPVTETIDETTRETTISYQENTTNKNARVSYGQSGNVVGIHENASQKPESVADKNFVISGAFRAPETSSFGKELERREQWLKTDMRTHLALSLSNAAQPVNGFENLSRMEFIGSKVDFESHGTWGDLPPAVQDELRYVLPALAVQESGYDNGVVSKDGALGIMQLLPGTIIDMYGAQDWSPAAKQELVRSVQVSLAKQVEVVGKYFVSMRYTIFDSEKHGMGEKAKRELERRHAGNLAAYEKEFMTMLLVNGYNAGPARMGGIVKEYFEVDAHLKNGLTGKDLFLDIIEWAYHSKEGMAAAFGDDARNYVMKIYAVRNLLAARSVPGMNTKIAKVTYDDSF